MADYAIVLPNYSVEDQKKLKFVYNIRKQAQGEEELEDWEGKIASLKRHTDGHNAVISSRMQSVEQELTKFQEKITEIQISQ